MFKPSARRPGRMGTQKSKPRANRVEMTKAASLCVDGANSIIPCTVRNLNSGGARISVANVAGVPDQVLLVVRSENLVAQAQAEWRDQVEMGLQFIRKGELFEEEKFRRIQAEIYAKEQEKIRRIADEKQRIEDEKRAEVELQNKQQAAENARLLHHLGLNPDRPFSEVDIKRAYRQLAMVKHPDHGGSMEEFMDLKNSYETLLAHLHPQDVDKNIMLL